jgi:hypothetical protein
MVGLLLLLFVGYIFPIAVLNYLTTGKFAKAFDINGIIGKSFSASYLVSWVVAMVYGVILAILLSWIPIIGPAIVSFIGGVTMWTIFGQVYSKLK